MFSPALTHSEERWCPPDSPGAHSEACPYKRLADTPFSRPLSFLFLLHAPETQDIIKVPSAQRHFSSPPTVLSSHLTASRLPFSSLWALAANEEED
ncbi:hypothetical protein NQZ68_020964 [Dissostichus eleginoides]|nr:hypothetical protein NQZ68_020964 [Dissostichus eleginoides]